LCEPGSWLTDLSGDMGNSSGMFMEVGMPWTETRVVDEKMSFIVEWRRREVSFAELCRRYGISRKSGYEVRERFEADGLDGLKGRSTAPHHHPNAVSAEVEAAVVAVRCAHPSWGPKKIRAWLEAKHRQQRWPAQSTIGALLDRHGLTKRRRVRRHAPPGARALSPCLSANDVWGVDFKGWFCTGDGRRCDPLSLSDLTTRYVLRLQVMERCDGEHVWPIFDAAFREFGLPRVMRSDNGPPFAGTGVGGLSALSVRLIKVGVLPERIAPGKPQQNGRHERLHLTLKEETASPPAASWRAQQRRFDCFRRLFNEERPHEALGQTPPAQHYQPSTRAYSGRLREPEYAGDHEVRRVRHNGEIKWRGQLVFIGEALVGEPVGLAETEDGQWQVRYGPIELGSIDAAGKFVRRKAGVHPRLAPQPQPPG
jgi:putative transposase